MKLRNYLLLAGIFGTGAYYINKYKVRFVMPKLGAVPTPESVKIFPIKGTFNWSNYTQRFNSGHEGIDIFANKGTPVVAVASGQVRFANEPKGGNAAYLVEPDGTQYYYAHLDRFGTQLSGSNVNAGEVIGYVGDTGNAQGREPHVHFEVRPGGGEKVDPYPLLNNWVKV